MSDLPSSFDVLLAELAAERQARQEAERELATEKKNALDAVLKLMDENKVLRTQAESAERNLQAARADVREAEIREERAERRAGEAERQNVADTESLARAEEMHFQMHARLEALTKERDTLKTELDKARGALEFKLDVIKYHVPNAHPDYVILMDTINDALTPVPPSDAGEDSVIEEIKKFALAHHADQDAAFLLHSLTVDIPAICDRALKSAPPAVRGEVTKP